MTEQVWFSSQPGMMFFHIMVTYWSRSERDCSCTKPRACINSWAATPDHMQPGVCSDRVWLPPVCPRNDQQLVVRNTNGDVSSSGCQVKSEIKRQQLKSLRSTDPYRGWMSRKLASWVRGTNLTHVPVPISFIPFSMVILSMSSAVIDEKILVNKKKKTKSHGVLRDCLKSLQLHRIAERWYTVRKRIHLLLWATGRRCWHRWWRYVWRCWQCLPLSASFLWGLATLTIGWRRKNYTQYHTNTKTKDCFLLTYCCWPAWFDPSQSFHHVL